MISEFSVYKYKQINPKNVVIEMCGFFLKCAGIAGLYQQSTRHLVW